jgi:hypothetical protein
MTQHSRHPTRSLVNAIKFTGLTAPTLAHDRRRSTLWKLASALAIALGSIYTHRPLFQSSNWYGSVFFLSRVQICAPT